MRILILTNAYPTPGCPASGIFVEHQIKSLRRIGLDIEILIVDRGQEGIKEYFFLRRKLLARCTEFCPDLVHSMYGGFMAYIMTKFVTDRPTVVSFCGSDLLGEHTSGYLRKVIAAFGVWSSWRAAKRASGIVVKSKNLLQSLPDNIPRDKARVIPNGIDIELFKPLDRDTCRKQLGWHNGRFHVLFATSSDATCKRPALAQTAVETANSWGIPTVMHKLHGIPHAQVPTWLNAADVVLLTSLHEGSPNIIKEALACNVPVVSVDVGDVSERISGIEGCYLALPESDDLAAKLCSVYAGSRRVGGRTKMQELSLERIALRLKEFYKEIFENRKIERA